MAVGGLSAFLTRGSMEAFNALNKPPLTPPGWLFPVVWTALFILMGIASYLVLTSGRTHQTSAQASAVRKALTAYGIQLAVNFVWPILFFNAKLYFFAFLWLVLLWLLIWLTFVLFYRISKPAGWLLVPYLIWVAFAGYLNLSIYLLN